MMVNHLLRFILFQFSCLGLSALEFQVYAQDNYEILPFPKIGPIVRHVATDRIELMGQGERGQDVQGIIRYAKILENGQLSEFSKPLTFPMLDDDRHVGHVAIEYLESGVKYHLQVGYLHSHVDPEAHLNWERTHHLTVMTHPIHQANQFSFLAGSCRRLEEILGFPLWAKRGDRIFKAMKSDVEIAEASGGKTNFIAFIGDQIYGDATPFNRCHSFTDFARRYELAFSQPYIRALMASGTPVYKMRDDHEWWDNVSQEQQADRPKEYQAALQAYNLFQRPQGKETPNWWYTISSDVNVFFMDVRSEREPLQKKMISVDQMNALKSWLVQEEQQDRIKVIVSAVPMFLQDSEDSWGGYKDQLSDLITYIIAHNIKYLMVLSGDAHCENEGMFTIYNNDGQKKGHILEILTSGLFAIFGTKGIHLDHQMDLKEQGYFLKADEGLHPIINKNLFARITGDHKNKTVGVRVYDRKNNLLKESHYDLEQGKMIPTL